MNEPPLRRKLLYQIEFAPICRKHRQTGARSRQEDECIVQALFALMALEILCSGQSAGDRPGLGPNLIVRCQ